MDLGLTGLRTMSRACQEAWACYCRRTLAAEGARMWPSAPPGPWRWTKRSQRCAEHGVTAVRHALDVRDAAALQAWVTALAQELGGLDIVIANVSALAVAMIEKVGTRNLEVDLMHTVHGQRGAALPEPDAHAAIGHGVERLRP